jgi:uncharacterized protein
VTEAVSVILSAAALIGIAAFFSLWVHRAEGNRALTMGLYIVFGAFGFFLFLFGAGSAFRDIREGNDIAQTSILAMAIGAIAGIGLLAPLRRAVARVIPFNPDSKPDMVGFILLGQIAALAIVSLFFEDTEVEPVGYALLTAQGLVMVALAYLAVGVFFYRTPGQATKRLGLVRPTAMQVVFSFGFVFLAFGVAIASSLLVQVLQPDLHRQIEDNLSRMTQDITTPWGALLLGIASGAGEETLFRGAIQPRFGIIFTALVFSVLHIQYGLSFITVGVFAAGVLFGLERKYLNTTCCIITHATYNTIAVLLAQMV